MHKIVFLIILSIILQGCSSNTTSLEDSVNIETITLHENNVAYTVNIVNNDYASTDKEIREYINSKPRKAQVLASLSEDLTYIPSQDGTEVDIESLLNDIHKGKHNINIVDYYNNVEQPEITLITNLLNRVNQFHITYTNGETISANDCGFTLSANYTVSANEDLVRKCVTDITLMYDTLGRDTYSYTRYDGQTLDVKSNTWGSLSDTIAEQDYILSIVNTLASEEGRTPIMKEVCPEELPTKRIEVDIDNQTVYVLKDQDLITESPVVTGRYPDRQTPKGVFKVLEKRKEKDLRGPGYVSHVHRWMRLTWSGVGLHDATWRSRFGGEIYKHDGSHGCINLPKDFAYNLYDMIEVGDCVIIY